MSQHAPEFVTSGTLFWTVALLCTFAELVAWCRRSGPRR